jgi:predicted outer membrane repeat protein
MKLLLTCFFAGALSLALPGQIYVKANATGANNGTSWANAYTSLGTALTVASTGTQLWVAAGTYKPDRDSLGNLTPADNRNKTFVLKNGVALYGGFAGTETTLVQRNVANNATILSGDIGVLNDSTDNIYHILQVRNLTEATRLDGVTVTLGFTAFITGGRSGSALNLLNGKRFFTIANCLISNNSNFVAVYCAENSGLTVENTTFFNNYNRVSLDGGALYCETVNDTLSLNLTNCVFKQNSGGQGGAISTKLKMVATGCIFESNRVDGSSGTMYGITFYSGGKGGGIYASTDLSLMDCAFYSCLSRASINMSVFGGAIYQETGKLKLEGCGFLGNTVACLGAYFQFADGGGVYTAGADTCFVNNCLFYANYVQGYFAASGAGMSCGRKISFVTNSVFTKNEVNAQAGANSGGGYVSGGNSTITNCTFVKNKAGSGAAILTSSSGGTNTVKNTLFWNNLNVSNTTDANTQIHNLSPSVTHLSYSLIPSGVPPTVTNGGNNLSSDPLLVNENDLFGPDRGWPTADDGFNLQAGSPAATAGTLIGAPLLDVLGMPRGNAPSIGAYQKNRVCSLSISSVAVQNATCNFQNGRLTILSTGNNGAVSYSLDSVTFQSLNHFSNRSADTYRVVIKDSSGCVATSNNLAILQTGVPTIAGVTAQNATCGLANGRLTIQAISNHVLSYSLDSLTFQSSPIFTNLAADTYRVVAKDTNGCVATRFNLEILQTGVPTITGVVAQKATCGLANGRLTIQAASNHVLSYSLDSLTFQSSPIFTNLAAGTYRVVAKDTNGCVATRLNIEILQTGVPTITSVLAQKATCGFANGRLTIQATSNHVLSYSLDNRTFQSSPSFTNLAAGMYQVVVKDTNGCVATRNGIEVLQTGVPMITGVIAQKATCGLANGRLTIQATSNHVLSYSLDSLTFQSSPIFNNLTAGMYRVVIRDTNGCVATRSNVEVLQTGVPTITGVTAQNTTCGLANGRLTIQAISNHVLSYSLDSLTFQSSPIFNNLAAGTYRVIAKDTNVCVVTATNKVIQNVGTRPTVTFAVSVQNLAATFTNNSTNIVNPTYVWRYGNGQTSTQTNPSFTYTYGQVGNYTAQLIVQNDGLCVDSTSRIVQILTNPTAEVESLKLSLYPNPVKEQLTLQSSVSIPIQIVNAIGERVHTGMLRVGETQIDVSRWSNGTYFLQGTGINIKFVKQ